LSSGQSSRLYKQLVDKEQKALNVGSYVFSLENPGLFLIYAIANMNVKANALDSAINAEITKVRDNVIDQKEFEKLRNQTEDDFVNSKKTDRGVALALADYYLFYNGDTGLINTELDRYMDVTREDIKRAADQYLTKQNETLLYYLPKSVQMSKEVK
jgi:zinc protease